MKCPRCGNKTDVLQTFAHDDHVIRVRGHRNQSKCWIRTKTIERFETYKPDNMVEGAQAVTLELSEVINQLKDFDVRLKRALGLDTLVVLLGTDSDEDTLFRSSE